MSQKNKRARNWCFTINNYTLEDINDIPTWKSLGGGFGKEVGESKTPHLQGFVCFKNAVSLGYCKDLHATAHWEMMNGNPSQSVAYCSKDGEYIQWGKCIRAYRQGAAPLRRARHARQGL